MNAWFLLLFFCFGLMLCEVGFKSATLFESEYEINLGSSELPFGYLVVLCIGGSGGGLAVASLLEMVKRIEQQQKISSCDG